MNWLRNLPPALLKGLSLLATALFVALAIVVGGGTPPSPQTIAETASDAADNLARAQENVRAAARDTEVLAGIAEDVETQLEASRTMLETQLEIEQSSREGLGLSRDLVDAIATVDSALEGLVEKQQSLAAESSAVTTSSESIEDAASDLDDRLDALMERFSVVTRESRELNRKARGFEEARP